MTDQTGRSRALDRVNRGSLCAGCGVCQTISPDGIRVELASSGYLRPRVTGPVSKEEDRRISLVCPGLGQTVSADGRTDDVLWGPHLSVQEGWANDDALRFRASSGGALSAICIFLLETGAVDGVVQVQADPDHPSGNVVTVSRSGRDVLEAAGSRYAPSAPLSMLSQYLEGTESFAFVGKPCDVAALRALADLDERVESRFPIVLSFFCAGVPSRHAGDDVIRKLGQDPETAKSFRYRGNGWPGMATVVAENGSKHTMTYQESWGKILSGRVQHRCKICADGTGKAADIVCADAWETDDKGYPLFEDQPGKSLVMGRTMKGERIIREAVSAGRITISPFDLSALASIQPGQASRRRALVARLLALRLLGRPVPSYVGLSLGRAARTATKRTLGRNFLGMVKRVATGRVGE